VSAAANFFIIAGKVFSVSVALELMRLIAASQIFVNKNKSVVNLTAAVLHLK